MKGLSLISNDRDTLRHSSCTKTGPATGLPTRTEQADLNLALYAGHGEFPRIIFAPGNLKDARPLTQNLLLG